MSVKSTTLGFSVMPGAFLAMVHMVVVLAPYALFLLVSAVGELFTSKRMSSISAPLVKLLQGRIPNRSELLKLLSPAAMWLGLRSLYNYSYKQPAFGLPFALLCVVGVLTCWDEFTDSLFKYLPRPLRPFVRMLTKPISK